MQYCPYPYINASVCNVLASYVWDRVKLVLSIAIILLRILTFFFSNTLMLLNLEKVE